MKELQVCDWCGAVCPIEDMEPEEAGEWICKDCFQRDIEKYGPIGGLK